MLIAIAVVTREQIRARGHRTLAELLADVPGFEGYRAHDQENGLSIEAMARGSIRAILVLWTVPPNSLQINGRSVTDDLALAAVRRGEILSGAGAVRWAADALLGAVRITTARGDDEYFADVAATERINGRRHGTERR